MTFRKPVIAAIEGAAVAGGFELCLCADLRVASETAYFGFYNRIWLFYNCSKRTNSISVFEYKKRKLNVPLIDGGTFMLTQLIGKGRAMDLILTGRRLEVQEAFDIGIVNRIVPQGQAITEAVKLANQIASQPQESLVHDKMMIHKGMSNIIRVILYDSYKFSCEWKSDSWWGNEYRIHFCCNSNC